jgi:hypothetical protein
MRWNTLAAVVAATAAIAGTAFAQTTPSAPPSASRATTGAGGDATMSGAASEPGGYMLGPQRQQPRATNKDAGGLRGFPTSPLVNGSSAGTYTGTGIVTGR